MAGGREQSGARETDTRSHETRMKLHREREGTTEKLTAGRNGVYGGSEMAVHAEGWTADPGDLGAAVFGVHGSCECEMGAGIGSRGARGGHGSLLNETEERATCPRREERARGGGCAAAVA